MKTTDSRPKRYREKYGVESWKLDAPSPEVLADVLESNIRELLNVSSTTG